MSETTTAPATGGESTQSETTNPGGDYDAIVEQLNSEGFAASADQDDVDQQTDELESPEGIPAKDTLKVNGKTIEKPYAEIKEMAQKYEATSMKLETAKKEITEARDMKAQLSSQQEAVKNLLGVLQRGDLETVAEFVTNHLNGGEAFNKAVINYSLKLYEQSKMSPEQREAIENRKLVEKYKREAEERQKSDQTRAFEYKVNQWSEHISQEVPKAIKEVGFVDSDFVREHIIATWRTALERGQNPTASAVAAFVKQRLDAAKIVPPAPKAPAVRPTATRESVGLTKSNGHDETGYKSWDEWKRTRGR